MSRSHRIISILTANEFYSKYCASRKAEFLILPGASYDTGMQMDLALGISPVQSLGAVTCTAPSQPTRPEGTPNSPDF